MKDQQGTIQQNADEHATKSVQPDGKLDADTQALAVTHATAVSIWDKEADRFWVRSNLMLVVSGILLGAAISQQIAVEVKAVASIFGIYFSWIWLILNKKSGYYVSRWRPMVEALELKMLESGSFPVLPLTFVRPDKEAIKRSTGLTKRVSILLGRERPRTGAGGLMMFIIWGFIATWVFMFVYNVPPLFDAVKKQFANSIDAIAPLAGAPENPLVKPDAKVEKATLDDATRANRMLNPPIQKPKVVTPGKPNSDAHNATTDTSVDPES